MRAESSATRKNTRTSSHGRIGEASKHGEEMLTRAQRIAKIGSWEWDIESGEVSWSDQVFSIFGLSPNDFQPRLDSFLNAIAPEDREHVRERIERALRGEPYRVEYRVRHTDGRIRHVLSQAEVDFDDRNSAVRLVGTVQDITDYKQAEEGRRRYELLAEHSRDIILFVARESGRILDANAAALHAYGYSQDELQRMTIRDLRSREARELTSSQMDEADRHGILFETTHRRKDGSLFPVEVSSQGAIIGEKRCLVSVIRDITERKQTESALQQRESQLRFHVENTPLAVIEWGPDFRLSGWSGEAERIFGWTSEEVIGKRQDDFRWVHEEDVQHVKKIAAGLCSGESPRSVSCNRNYRKDGSVVYCEWYNSSRLDDRGNLLSILSLVLDVTEQRRLEEELRRRAEEIEKLMDVAPVAIWVASDPECRSISGNRKANLMYDAEAGENVSPTAPEQRSHRRFFRNGQELKPEELPMQYAAAHNVDVQGEVEVLLPSGRMMTMYGYSSPLRDADGQVRGCVGAFLDITARKKAEQALIRSEKLASVGRMAATIAHEINNPLAAVMNTLYLAKSTVTEPEVVRQYLDIADAELKRIAHMTRQALGFYRESAAPTVTDVREIIGSVLDLLKSKINSKRVHMFVESEDELPLKAASGEIRQVISNIVANSLDAIDDGGTIKIRVSAVSGVHEASLIRVTVADNGYGMSAPVLTQIFEPFFTTKHSVGTGLGLWISKQIVQKHGGVIRVRSKTAGRRRGTTFSITLPGLGDKDGHQHDSTRERKPS